jgi:hypothetical protein
LATADRRSAGIFLTHYRSPRIRTHYRRLVEQTGHLIRWRLVYNPGNAPQPITRIRYPDPALVCHNRHQQMQQHGGVIGGYLDVMIIPCVLGLRARHTWVMEYDVDYAGSWDNLFEQFVDSDADLITSSLMTRAQSPQWWHWRNATAPAWVDEGKYLRGFHPLMRLSRRFAQRYAVMTADLDWRGHCEFTIPTAARASGSRIEDLGDFGQFARPHRARNYQINPSDGPHTSATYVWRPARRRYFHEAPEAYPHPNLLYHPVKPGVPVKGSR